MSSPFFTPWSPTRIAELKRRWADGESIDAIGRAMGLTRNQVVGKAHRLGLKGREPCFQKRDPAKAAAPRPAPRPAPRTTPWSAERIAELKLLVATGATNPAIAAALRVTVAAVAGQRLRLGLTHLAPLAGGARTISRGFAGSVTGGCKWIDGDPRVSPSTCGIGRVEGRPYCAAHCARAYVGWSADEVAA